MSIKIKDLYDLEHTIAKQYLEQFTYPFEALEGIKDFINKIGPKLNKDEFNKVNETSWVHKDVKVYPNVYFGEYIIIGKGSEIRPGAFLRGPAIVGENCVIGNSTELKNVILFDNVQVPHYNYVGDSILGYKAHMGAGSITSNVKADKSIVEYKLPDEKTISTNRKKVGAAIGDYVEVGCNSVLNPGTVLGRRVQIYPLSSVRGVIEEDNIYKDKDNIVKRK